MVGNDSKSVTNLTYIYTRYIYWITDRMDKVIGNTRSQLLIKSHAQSRKCHLHPNTDFEVFKTFIVLLLFFYVLHRHLNGSSELIGSSRTSVELCWSDFRIILILWGKKNFVRDIFWDPEPPSYLCGI